MSSLSNQKSVHIKAIILLNATCLLWAGNILFGRLLREFIGPMFIVAVRSLVGALVFGLIIWFFGRRDVLRRVSNWPVIVLMGLCGVIFFQVLFYYGLRYTTMLNASIINSFIPIATALLAMLFFGSSLQRHQWLAALVTIIGIGWIMSAGDINTLLQLRFNLGDCLILGSVFSWALYGVLGKRMMGEGDLSAMEFTALGMFVAAIPILPMAFWEARVIPPEINQFVIFALIFICIGPTILCMFWWNRGVQLIGPAHAAIYMNLIPVYVVILSYFFVGEAFGWHHLGGGTLVVGASLYLGVSAIRGGQT